jgi:hypothetical protein
MAIYELREKDLITQLISWFCEGVNIAFTKSEIFISSD